ncbi:MAG: tetratricopeptide repeat protein [Anaerolineae bacterium]|nr:tetratricopeptide repeat protein [Anaerolineae bacterium]
MDDTTLTVFISSKMQELAAERTAIYDLLTQMGSGPLHIKAWAYERDAHAASYPIRDVYLKILEESALYIGLFWKAFGEWTIDEFRRASEWHIDRLLFVKADERDSREAKLNEFLDEVAPVDKGLAPIWFTDVDDLRGKVEHSLKVWINEKLTYRPGSANAVLVTDPDDVPHQPRKLIGRDDLLAQLRTALSQNSRVLLQGFGGMGKTALAATAAAAYLKANPGPLLWQEIGKESSDAIFEALARPFNAVQQIAREQGPAKIQAMRALLRQTGVKLVVLDNAWDGPALKTVLEAVPRDVPVIVTSRHAYPLDLRMEVDELSPASAVETLAFYAGNPALINDSAAAELCQLLGYLAFALEIAGKQLMVDQLTPAQLKTRIESAPAKMNMPLSFSQEGRRSVGDLLETSIEALDRDTRRVFMTFGAFFAPQVTPEMLILYLEDMAVNEAVTALLERGLVQEVPATDEQILSYHIHDLAFSFLGSQSDDTARSRTLGACLIYTEAYNEPSPANFAALQPELDNLMGAAAWAYGTGHFATVERFAQNLWENSEFLDYRGLYTQAIGLLRNAAHTAERQGNLWNQGAHLGNLGLAYYSLGDYPQAIGFCTQALTIQRQIGDKQGEGGILGNLGNTYSAQGDYPQAIDFYTQTLAIAQQIGDKRSEGGILGNLGSAYSAQGDYPQAIDFHQQALVIARQIGDKQNEGNHLGNLGSAYFSLGNYPQAIDFHQQALVIARQIGNKHGEGSDLGNLGDAYASLGDYPQAIDFHQQALAIRRQIGDKHGEGSDLGSLGSAYFLLGDYPQAIDFHQQALVIARQIGNKHGECYQLGNLGNAYSKLGDYPNAIQFYQQALAISRQIGDKHGEGSILGNLGSTYANLGDIPKGIDFFQQAWTIFVDIGMPHEVERVGRLIAKAQAKLEGGAAGSDPPPAAE